MPLNEVLSNINTGGIVATLVIILSLVEIVPVKLSPLQFIGRRLNKETLDKVKGIEGKLDEHVAQSYRSKILSFQDDILAQKRKTKEQWKEVVNAIYKYEKYCTDNSIDNGLCKEASEFLTDEYQNRLHNNDFE